MQVLLPLVLLLLVPVLSSIVHADQTFNFVGDVGCSTSKGKAVLSALKKDGHFTFILGDTSYKNSITCFTNAAKGLKYYVIMGNHDAQKSKISKYIKDNLTPIKGKTFWSITMGNVTFYGFDKNVSWKTGSPQYNIMNRTTSTVDTPFKVALTHQLFNTYQVLGGHKAEKGYLATYEDMFLNNNVTTIIQAHNHVRGIQNNVDLNYLICGQGGKGGDKVGEHDAWISTGATPYGYCQVTFNNNGNVEVQMKDTDNKNVGEAIILNG